MGAVVSGRVGQGTYRIGPLNEYERKGGLDVNVSKETRTVYPRRTPSASSSLVSDVNASARKGGLGVDSRRDNHFWESEENTIYLLELRVRLNGGASDQDQTRLGLTAVVPADALGHLQSGSRVEVAEQARVDRQAGEAAVGANSLGFMVRPQQTKAWTRTHECVHTMMLLEC